MVIFYSAQENLTENASHFISIHNLRFIQNLLRDTVHKKNNNIHKCFNIKLIFLQLNEVYEIHHIQC